MVYTVNTVYKDHLDLFSVSCFVIMFQLSVFTLCVKDPCYKGFSTAINIIENVLDYFSCKDYISVYYQKFQTNKK